MDPVSILVLRALCHVRKSSDSHGTFTSSSSKVRVSWSLHAYFRPPMKVRQTCNLGVQWIKFSMHSEKYVHFTFHKVDSNYIVVLSVHVHMSESIVLCQCSCHILILWGTYSSCPSFLFLEQSLFSFSRKSKNKECVSLSTSQIVFTVQRTGVCLDVCFLKGLGN